MKSGIYTSCTVLVMSLYAHWMVWILRYIEGEFCAIVGTSGSGKSTLLNMLAGLEKPTKGEVIIAGKHIEKLNEEQLVTFRRIMWDSSFSN